MKSGRPPLSAEEVQARVEDLTWMAETGESFTGAAARLGLSRNGLERFCQRHDLIALADRLRARDPRLTYSRTSSYGSAA